MKNLKLITILLLLLSVTAVSFAQDKDEYERRKAKLEKEIAGTENPTTQKIEKLAKLKSEYDIERREFVEDMLELD